MRYLRLAVLFVFLAAGILIGIQLRPTAIEEPAAPSSADPAILARHAASRGDLPVRSDANSVTKNMPRGRATGRVEGSVTSPTGIPVPGVLVIAWQEPPGYGSSRKFPRPPREAFRRVARSDESATP